MAVLSKEARYLEEGGILLTVSKAMDAIGIGPRAFVECAEYAGLTTLAENVGRHFARGAANGVASVAADGVSRVFSGMEEACAALFASFTRVFAELKNWFSAAYDTCLDFISCVLGVLKTVGVYCKEQLEYLSILLFDLARNTNPVGIVLFVTAMVASALGLTGWANTIVETVVSMYNRFSQFLFGDKGTVQKLHVEQSKDFGILLFAAVALMSCRSLPDVILKVLGGFGNYKRAAEAVNETGGNLFRSIVRMMGYSDDVFDDDYQRRSMGAVATEVVGLLESMKATRSQEDFVRASELCQKLYASGRPELRGFADQLRRVIQAFALAPTAGSGSRPEPVVVAFTGSPACGKSYLITNTFRSELFKAVIGDEELAQDLPKNMELDAVWRNFCYAAAPEEAFGYEGYNGNYAISFEDFQQTTEPAKLAQLATHITQLISPAPYQLPQAFETKGNVWANMRVLIMTSNATEFKNQHALNHRAYARRFKNAQHTRLNAAFVNLKDMMQLGQDVPAGGWPVEEWKKRIAAFGFAKDNEMLNMECKEILLGISGLSVDQVNALTHRFCEYQPTGTIDSHDGEGSPVWIDELVSKTVARLKRTRKVWLEPSATLGPFKDARFVEQDGTGRVKTGPSDDFDWDQAIALVKALSREVSARIVQWYCPDWLRMLVSFGAAYVGTKAAIWCLSKIFGKTEQAGNTQAIAARTSKNVVMIHVDGVGVIGFGLIVTNRAIIYPHHFNTKHPGRAISMIFDGMPIPFGNTEVAVASQQDLCMRVINLPREVNGKTFGAFVTSYKFGQLTAQDRTRSTTRISFIDQGNVERCMEARLSMEVDDKRRHICCAGYNSRAGDCGLPVYWDEGLAEASPILGIHVGAQSYFGNAGYFTVVTQELLSDMLAQLRLPTASVPTVAKAQEQPTTVPAQRQKLDAIFGADRASIINATAQTRKTMSTENAEALRGIVPAVKVEARCFAQAGKFSDHLVLANLNPEYRVCAHGKDCRLKECQVVPGKVHQDASDQRTGLTPEARAVGPQVVDHVISMVTANVKQPFVVLEVADTVGDRRLPYFTPYNYGSGQGFVTEDEKVNKEIIESREYAESVEAWMASLYTNPTAWPVKIFAKDEAITFKKYLAGRTRQIASHPPHVKIAERCFKGELINHLYNHQFDGTGGFANAFNPFMDGHRLRRWLVHDGWKYFDIDIKQQDATLSEFMTGAWTKLVLACYDANHPLYRSLIAHMDIMHCSYNAFASGYREAQGCWRFDDISSGKYDTSVENTFCAILMAHVALAILSVRRGKEPRHYFDQIRVVASGDDVVVALGPEVHSSIPAEEWIDAYRQMGMTATSGSKDSELVYYDTLDECVFLKRTFDLVVDPQGETTVSARLALKSIFKRFVFHRAKLSPNEVGELKTVAYYELARHGREVYDQLAPKIGACFKKRSNNGLVPSWADAWEGGTKLSTQQRDLSQPFGSLFERTKDQTTFGIAPAKTGNDTTTTNG